MPTLVLARTFFCSRYPFTAQFFGMLEAVLPIFPDPVPQIIIFTHIALFSTSALFCLQKQFVLFRNKLYSIPIYKENQNTATANCPQAPITRTRSTIGILLSAVKSFIPFCMAKTTKPVAIVDSPSSKSFHNYSYLLFCSQ